jgi:hypothetical protein
MSGTPTGYVGFESPEEQYYGTSPTLPVLYTGAWQTRQFGVGGAKTLGRPYDVSTALASPPTKMTTAANDSITNATGLYVVTANDIFNYHTH